MNATPINPALRPIRLHSYELLLLAKAMSAEADARRREGNHELADLHEARAAELERIAR